MSVICVRSKPRLTVAPGDGSWVLQSLSLLFILLLFLLFLSLLSIGPVTQGSLVMVVVSNMRVFLSLVELGSGVLVLLCWVRVLVTVSCKYTLVSSSVIGSCMRTHVSCGKSHVSGKSASPSLHESPPSACLEAERQHSDLSTAFHCHLTRVW